jgi:hypothetical protein
MAGNFRAIDSQTQTPNVSKEKLVVHQFVEDHEGSVKCIKQGQELRKYRRTKDRIILQKKSPACARFAALAECKVTFVESYFIK